MYIMAQNKLCNRCYNKELTISDFDINLKTNEYYKSCNKCREYDMQRKINNRDKTNAQSQKHYQETKDKQIERAMQWQKNNKDRLDEIIMCECGGKCQRRIKYKHDKSKKHLAYLETLNK